MEGDRSISVSEEVLLTPRVLDESAFETFAGRLRALIGDASSRERRLIAASASVDEVVRSLGDGTAAIAERLERAGELLPRLERRLGEAEAMLERSLDPHVIAGRVRDRLDEISGARAQELESAGSALVERFEAAARDAAARVEAAVRELEGRVGDRVTHAEERIGELLAALERREREASSRAHTLEVGIGDALRRATERAEREAAERIVEIRRRVDETVGVGESNAGALVERLSAQEREAESRVREAETTAQRELTRAAGVASARCDEAARVAESAFATAVRRIDTDAGARIAEIESRASAMLTSIEEAVARVEAAGRLRTEEAEQLDGSLATRLGQLSEASARLDGMIREATTALASLESSRSRVMAETRDALELLARSRGGAVGGAGGRGRPRRAGPRMKAGPRSVPRARESACSEVISRWREGCCRAAPGRSARRGRSWCRRSSRTCRRVRGRSRR